MSVLLTVALIAAGSKSPVKPNLSIGDPAPALSVAKWIKGTPIPSLAPGKVYVVEFWATWCGPCRQAAPHLTALAKKYENKASFIGVSVWEKNNGSNAFLGDVAKFVQEQGPNMGYNVGADNLSGAMAKTWLAPAGQGGIPVSFLVDRKSRVVWIGSPSELETPLKQVVDNTFDLEANKKRENEALDREKAHDGEFAALHAALKANDSAKIVTEVDRLWPLYPKEHQGLLFQKAKALSSVSSDAANKYLKDLAQASQDDRAVLWSIGWEIGEPRFGLKSPDYALGISCVKRAIALSSVPDWNLETILAMCYFGAGDKSEAVSTQTYAVTLAAKTPELSDDNQKALRNMLHKYKGEPAE